jgi:hypothetical protein
MCRDVEERGSFFADRGTAAGEVGEGEDGDEGDVMLVSEEGHDVALHLHGLRVARYPLWLQGTT